MTKDPLRQRPDERRRAPRFNIALPVTITATETGRMYPATVDNISLGGVLLITDAPLEEGARLVIHLPIAADMTMRIEAALRRIANAGEFGVAFISLTDEELDRLSDFVEQRSTITG